MSAFGGFCTSRFSKSFEIASSGNGAQEIAPDTMRPWLLRHRWTKESPGTMHLIALGYLVNSLFIVEIN